MFKILQLIEPPSKAFLEKALLAYGLDPKSYPTKVYPQEDFLLTSQKYPIFVVADGVTLIQFLIEKKAYPNPSPAGELSQVFCSALVQATEERYEQFQRSDLPEIFKVGNEAARKYNAEHGRTRATSDFWHNDLYAATTAFMIVKDEVVYWASLCDSYAIHTRGGELLFTSPECHALTEEAAPPYTGDPQDKKARAQYAWSTKRNGISANNKRIGYGVVTGEESATRYLNTGSFKTQPGDLVTILTDGFEEYLKLPEFRALLARGPEADDEVREFTRTKSIEDPEKYGHERSLIAISF